ncbi:hypothetical protein ACOMHN_022994 [Nucella lapillus]
MSVYQGVINSTPPPIQPVSQQTAQQSSSVKKRPVSSLHATCCEKDTSEANTAGCPRLSGLGCRRHPHYPPHAVRRTLTRQTPQVIRFSRARSVKSNLVTRHPL